jgi:PHS family inorganic phosphate transporter-like MFS transporter
LTISETPRYKIEAKNAESKEVNNEANIQEEKEVPEKTKASFKEFFSHFSKWKNGKVLLGSEKKE